MQTAPQHIHSTRETPSSLHVCMLLKWGSNCQFDGQIMARSEFLVQPSRENSMGDLDSTGPCRKRDWSSIELACPTDFWLTSCLDARTKRSFTARPLRQLLVLDVLASRNNQSDARGNPHTQSSTSEYHASPAIASNRMNAESESHRVSNFSRCKRISRQSVQ